MLFAKVGARINKDRYNWSKIEIKDQKFVKFIKLVKSNSKLKGRNLSQKQEKNVILVCIIII